jgi:hypothetical protein
MLSVLSFALMIIIEVQLNKRPDTKFTKWWRRNVIQHLGPDEE